MLIYHGEQIEAAVAGRRIVAVKCDKCSCQYYYELVRVGWGASMAHYGLGKDAAKRSSHEKSQRDLAGRLAREAELVPCPKCNWVNEDLVEGYRRGRARRLGEWALVVAIVGTAVSLIMAWFTSIVPHVDRRFVASLLLYGPALSISLGMVLYLLRAWVRGRVQPNRDFPFPPHLPPGSPPALLLDEESRTLRIAGAPRAEANGSGWHEFRVGRDQLPPVCCDCLSAAAPGHGYYAKVSNAIKIEVPRCASCASRARRKSWRIGLTIASIGLLVEYAVLLALRMEPVSFWILFAACAIVVSLTAAWIASAATVPVKVRIVDRSRWVLRLRFRNRDYGRPSISPEKGRWS